MLIVVTGASRGIGLELVKRLSQERGVMVIAVSRNVAPLSRLRSNASFQNVLPLQADISSEKGRKLVGATVKKLKMDLFALVNNAGALVNKPFARISEKELKAVYEVNLMAPFLLTQQLLPFFGKASSSHIVNIGSIGGIQGSAKFAGLSAYSSSKGALALLTECLAEELRPLRISVNCLALGAVQTDMLEKAFPGYKAPLKPDEIAGYICNFVLTGHGFFNGKILPVSSTTP
jgi:3-oxoacyl-[acyl-carrier protein] reductase